MTDGRHVEFVTHPTGVTHIKQGQGDSFYSQAFVRIKVEYNADNLGLILFDGHDTVLFVITLQLVIAKHMTVFDGLPKAKLQTVGQFSHLILSNAGHNH